MKNWAIVASVLLVCMTVTGIIGGIIIGVDRAGERQTERMTTCIEAGGTFLTLQGSGKTCIGVGANR